MTVRSVPAKPEPFWADLSDKFNASPQTSKASSFPGVFPTADGSA